MRSNFKYEKEVQFSLGLDKAESKEYGIITGKRYPMFDYTGNIIVTKDSNKK